MKHDSGESQLPDGVQARLAADRERRAQEVALALEAARKQTAGGVRVDLGGGDNVDV